MIRSHIQRLARAVGRLCAAMDDLLTTEPRAETTEDAEIARRVAAEARADRLEQELRRARDELERVAESADARDEMRRRQAN